MWKAVYEVAAYEATLLSAFIKLLRKKQRLIRYCRLRVLSKLKYSLRKLGVI